MTIVVRLFNMQMTSRKQNKTKKKIRRQQFFGCMALKRAFQFVIEARANMHLIWKVYLQRKLITKSKEVIAIKKGREESSIIELVKVENDWSEPAKDRQMQMLEKCQALARNFDVMQ